MSLFRKREITVSVEDARQENEEQIHDDFELSEPMQRCIDEAEDLSLFLIANGVTATDLASFVKITALLKKANFSKEVTPGVQKKWTKTMDENVSFGIPPKYFLTEYEKRTTYNRSIINALASFFHLDKKPQAYVTVSPMQEDRNEMPEGFAKAFSSYERTTEQDSITSQECLLKSTKSQLESYKSKGGIMCVENVEPSSPHFMPILNAAAAAYQSDKIPLVSKIADPFAFVCNNIDTPKKQSMEHDAMKRLYKLFPGALFYDVSDKVSQLDVENHQMTALPDGRSPYIKFKPSGKLGDIFTNYHIFDKCGIVYGSTDFLQIPEKDRTYDDVNLQFEEPLRSCVEALAGGGLLEAPPNFKFGKYDVSIFIPAKLGRVASLSDLDDLPDTVQLVTLNFLAGASSKEGRIFSSHRFYWVDVASHLCIAVPAGYRHDFEPLRIIEKDKLKAADFGSLFISTNNVKLYMAAASEVNSYVFPLLWKFYRNLDFRSTLVDVIQNVLDSVKHPVSGVSFLRTTNLFFDTFSLEYVFLVGSSKIDDRRVLSYYGESKLDQVVDYVPVKGKVNVGEDRELQKKRIASFNFPSPSARRAPEIEVARTEGSTGDADLDESMASVFTEEGASYDNGGGSSHPLSPSNQIPYNQMTEEQVASWIERATQEFF